MSKTPNKGIDYVPEGTVDPAAGLNAALNTIDAIDSVTRVISMSLTAPPGSGADGDLYIVGLGATGSWVGLDNFLVRYVAAGDFWLPFEPGTQVAVVLNRADGALYLYDDDNSPNGWRALQAAAETSSMMIVCSDETTALVAAANTRRFRMPYGFHLTAVRASVNTAPTGQVLQVDINESGASILSTKLTIDAGEKTSVTAAVPAVISDANLADDAEIAIDIDQIGSGTAGNGLKVYLIGYRVP